MRPLQQVLIRINLKVKNTERSFERSGQKELARIFLYTYLIVSIKKLIESIAISYVDNSTVVTELKVVGRGEEVVY